MWLLFWSWYGNDCILSSLPAFGVSIKDWGKRKAREQVASIVERVRDQMGRRAWEEHLKSEWGENVRNGWGGNVKSEWGKNGRVSEGRIWRVSEERTWGVFGECVYVCVWVKRECVWYVCEMCVRVKGELTKVCMRLEFKKSRVWRRMQSVCSPKPWASQREREQRVRREKNSKPWKNCLSACTQKRSLSIFIMHLADICALLPALSRLLWPGLPQQG